jgi:hypothetical protein
MRLLEIKQTFLLPLKKEEIIVMFIISLIIKIKMLLIKNFEHPLKLIYYTYLLNAIQKFSKNSKVSQ